MKRPLTLAFVTFLLVGTSFGDEAPPPPITRETLAGVWEAAPAGVDCVYRLEISKTGPSYLVFFLGDTEQTYRLISSEVDHGRITLRFRNVMPQEYRDYHYVPSLVVRAKGMADKVWGKFDGTLCGKKSFGKTVQSTPISFSTASWTRDLPALSKRSEKLLTKAKKAAH